jgi:hypothetical protein
MQHNMLALTLPCGASKAEYLLPRPLALRPLPRSGLSPLKRASPSGTCWKGCPSLPAGASLQPQTTCRHHQFFRETHTTVAACCGWHCMLHHHVCRRVLQAYSSGSHCMPYHHVCRRVLQGVAQFGKQVLFYSLSSDEAWLLTKCVANHLPRPRPRPLPLPLPLSAMP